MRYTQQDLFLLTAMELKIPQEQVEFVVKNSFNLLRQAMIKHRGKDILLNEFVRFTFKFDKWEKYLENLKNKNVNEEETITQDNN